VKLYGAGNVDDFKGFERRLAEAGLRHRLVSYYDLDPDQPKRRGRPAERFWIAARLMRLFFATPRQDPEATILSHYDAGMRNVLLSFANAGRFSGKEWEFWVERRAEAMKLYAAGTGGATQDAANEKKDVASGLAQRLISFADTSMQHAGHRATSKFWIDARAEAMKLYVAGNGKSAGSAERDHDAGLQNRLLSYAFLDDWARDDFAFWMHPDRDPRNVSVFLDSGAYSARTLGRVIDLEKYCDYVEANRAALAAYAVLDVIGDLSATKRNLARMHARGLKPVPIYHAIDPVSELEELLAEGHDYIAIGGMASEAKSSSRVEREKTLEACWKVIGRHWPVKVHGLGLLSQWALERYPFYSVDGSSAIMGAGMGRVMRFEDGQLRADGWKDHVSRTWDGAVADGVGRVAKAEGKSDSAHEGRRVANIRAQLLYERYITDLWTARGVSW
jgi:hypothetical protein